MSSSEPTATPTTFKMARTIHPVGQGGFYTEFFRNPDGVSADEKCFVYDCGSSTFKRKGLESIILSSIPENLDIEALFLSHFDADHVNGIEILAQKRKIKHIVIPQIDGLGWFYVLVNRLETETDKTHGNANIAERIHRICEKNDIRLIQVKPFSREGDGDGGDGPATDFSEITENTLIESGRRLTFNQPAGHIWEYIPINTSDQSKIDRLKSELDSFLKTKSFKDDSIDSIPTDRIIEIVSSAPEDINGIYKNVFRTSNNSSMCLYSGSLGKETDIFFYHNPWWFRDFYEDYYFFHFNRFNRTGGNEACLYTGDANLIDDELIRHIQNRLGHRLERIGLVQIPHHGSTYNSNDAVFSKLVNGKPIVLFVSFGKNNRYGHPSHHLMESLLISDLYVFQVTEDQDSAVYQKIIVWN